MNDGFEVASYVLLCLVVLYILLNPPRDTDE